MKLHQTIQSAKKVLSQHSPLNAFIAVNPLWELRDKNFFEAVGDETVNGLMPLDYYKQRFDEQLITRDSLKQALTKVKGQPISQEDVNAWLSAEEVESTSRHRHLLLAEIWDEYEFENPVVWIQNKIFTLLRDFFGLGYYKKFYLLDYWKQENPDFDHLFQSSSSKSIENTIVKLLDQLSIPHQTVLDYLQVIYFNLYGWSSLMNWRNHHQDNDWLPGQDPCEVMLLMWLAYEYKISTEKNETYATYVDSFEKRRSRNSKFNHRRYIWQTAFELSYLDKMDLLINNSSFKIDEQQNTPDAQFIFCIDTRSEGFRRHIEAQGNYETYGFAGFFGTTFKLNDFATVSSQAPALIQPTVTLTSRPTVSPLTRVKRQIRAVIQRTKAQLAAPFALFEMLGVWFFFFMVFKSLQPKISVKKTPTNLSIPNELSENHQFEAAHQLLVAIGLVKNFAKSVIIASHQADTINDPFKSSLNCGACGGNSGAANALIICDVLNNPVIRKKLKAVGILIPDDTTFIPACHHTGYDRLEILQYTIDESVMRDIDRAAQHLRTEKAKQLPGQNAMSQREMNWSELYPELGLVNNSAIIIAPRQLTRQKNLHRQVFLHSYEPVLDSEGEILASILSAPAIVAHWISSQYYFSTVNPTLFGAGNKAIHNVLPGIGVLEGNLSDLKIGLPQQSTHFRGVPLHAPRRLIVVVYAPQKVLDAAIEQSPEFQQLLANHWLYLKHIEPHRPIQMA